MAVPLQPSDESAPPPYRFHNSIAMLGLIHQFHLGDPEKAEKLYKVVLKDNPDHILTLDHKCALDSHRGNADEAARLHRRICNLDPNHTRKSCPYLDSLFPTSTALMHKIAPMKVSRLCSHPPPARARWIRVIRVPFEGFGLCFVCRNFGEIGATSAFAWLPLRIPRMLTTPSAFLGPNNCKGRRVCVRCPRQVVDKPPLAVSGQKGVSDARAGQEAAAGRAAEGRMRSQVMRLHEARGKQSRAVRG